MSDAYGKGYYGSGSRPLTPGADQSAYDIGAQRRQSEQFMRQQERQQQAYDAQRRQQEAWRNHQTDNSSYTAATGSANYTPPTADEIAKTRDAISFFVGIGAFIFALVALWNGVVGSLNPANPVLAAIVQHGAWGVGIGGFLIGRHIYKLLSKIVAILIGIFLLIVAIGFVLGVISGVTEVMNR